MSFKGYLISLLGKKKYEELERAIKSGKTIVISGVNGSGKTTLVKVLREKGYNAVEDFEVCNINLEKALDEIVPNKKSEIF